MISSLNILLQNDTKQEPAERRQHGLKLVDVLLHLVNTLHPSLNYERHLLKPYRISYSSYSRFLEEQLSNFTCVNKVNMRDSILKEYYTF